MPELNKRLHRMKLSAAFLAAICLSLLSGCVSKYAIQQNKARDALMTGDYQSAAAFYLADRKSTDYVDVLLNRGLAEFETKDYVKAEEDLKRAYDRIDELYTKSISRGALSVITNDRALAYSGTNFEKGMIHYYRGLGYLARNDREGFSIEARALNKYLTELPGQSNYSDVDYGFLRYYTGVGYDLAAQSNDAWIAYERAREIFAKQVGTIPRYVSAVSAQAGKRAGTVLPDSLRRAGYTLPDTTVGRVILFIETGVCAGLQQSDITIPLYETDRSEYPDNFDYYKYGNDLHHRRGDDRHQRIVDWIRIAIPTVVNEGKSQIDQVRIATNGIQDGEAALSADLSFAFERDFNDRLPGIIGRTFARTVAKRAAANFAKQQGGEAAFWLTRLAGELTETADTRSWALLPDRIYVWDTYVPVGTKSIKISGQSNGSLIDTVELSDLSVEAGKTTIRRIRLRG